MKVQRVSYYLSLLSAPSLSTASFLDFNYDFCDSSSILSSFNPLCERPGVAPLDLSISHGSASIPQHVLSPPHQHNHDHDHDHDHGAHDSSWSHTPHCFHRSNTSSPSDNYCVFTDSTFASNRGISIYANALYSASLHTLPAFTTPSLLTGANAQSDHRYASRPIPKKGLGLVALIPIHRGEQLFRSTPVVIFQEDDEGVSAGGNETERLPYYQRAVGQLPPKSKGLFDELKGHFGTDPVRDKVDTNCFAVELDVEGLAVTATAVFPEMSVRCLLFPISIPIHKANAKESE